MATKSPVDLVFAGGTVHGPSIRPSFSSPPERTLISEDTGFL